jgi:hypothetical protein
MKLVEPTLNWQEAKDKLWKDCSSLGEAGTKEKEKNMQTQILTNGVEVPS